MVLKSYRLKVKKKKKKRNGSRDIISGGVNALIGIALVSETARAVSRI